MKHNFILLLLLVAAAIANGQQTYWVFLSDKAGSQFDPYAYFDAKAIARYNANGFDLYDTGNYPVSERYAAAVLSIAPYEVGRSRWLNAIAVEASAAQIAAIEGLPFVVRCQPLANADMLTAAHRGQASDSLSDSRKPYVSMQLRRMQGDLFRHRGIDGKGVRIAVFDGGFPKVDKHEAFQHLRDNRQIVKTWNFCDNKEDVYGWNSHGTMTLSCIAGIADNQQLGLATGAEFLLARTEVELEPFKEEVWWMEAMEWADANGADIISSSLGYGKERHYTTDMDGTSYVARAANMAARRGILVCNSAGNEADTRAWRTIITPADADSVLCVGGIEADPDAYRHIDFSSIGPSADMRLKPNVAAFGHALVANPKGGTEWVDGTSFSCPLVAGFAACAMQARPDLKGMDLFRAIEQSGDLNPYYDYFLGYGVPQASYFLNDNNTTKKPTFRFDADNDVVAIVSLVNKGNATLFVHRRDNRLKHFNSYAVDVTLNDTIITYSKSLVGTDTLAASLEGYGDLFVLPSNQAERYAQQKKVTNYYTSMQPLYSDQETWLIKGVSQWGDASKYRFDIYWQFGTMLNSHPDEVSLRGFSPVNRLGVRFLRAFSKPYCVGLGLEWGMANYRLLNNVQNNLDQALSIPKGVKDKKATQGEVTLELFQRVRFVAGGMLSSRGIYWDLGIYGSYNYYSYKLTQPLDGVANRVEMAYRRPDFTDAYRWNWGLTTRLGYSVIAIYARYRLTGLGSDETIPSPAGPNDFYLHLPRLEAGLQLAF